MVTSGEIKKVAEYLKDAKHRLENSKYKNGSYPGWAASGAMSSMESASTMLLEMYEELYAKEMYEKAKTQVLKDITCIVIE